MQPAPGVHRLGERLVNWFVIEEGGRLTIVDAGNPKQYGQLPSLLDSLGRRVTDIEAIVLTHAHGDHLGSSARISSEADAPVHVHADDVALARGEEEREAERSFVRDLRSLHALKSLVFFLRGGALKAPPVVDPVSVEDGGMIDVPGRLRVVHLPGHTKGSCALLATGAGVLFSGDSLVTLNIVTGALGPRIMPGAFNRDSARALASLDRLAGIEADVVLPGHGEPWRDGVAEAVRLARAAGPS